VAVFFIADQMPGTSDALEVKNAAPAKLVPRKLIYSLRT
jgi:hypothetical protein